MAAKKKKRAAKRCAPCAGAKRKSKRRVSKRKAPARRRTGAQVVRPGTQTWGSGKRSPVTASGKVRKGAKVFYCLSQSHGGGLDCHATPEKARAKARKSSSWSGPPRPILSMRDPSWTD